MRQVMRADIYLIKLSAVPYILPIPQHATSHAGSSVSCLHHTLGAVVVFAVFLSVVLTVHNEIIGVIPRILVLNRFYQMSRVVRKPDFCICENKDADQLRGNREADQRLCFRYTDSTIPLPPKSKLSSL